MLQDEQLINGRRCPRTGPANGGAAFGSPMSAYTMSELTAYYLGLTDRCADVEKYGLPESQHLTSAE